EYDYMFLGLSPMRAVITNIEHDHPDLFPTAESFQDAFREFVNRLKPDGTLFLCAEDSGAMQMKDEIKPGQQLVVYGFQAPGRDYLARNLKININAGIRFEVVTNFDQDCDPVEISLQIPGKHNVLNALAAFAVADQMGLPRVEISRVLSEFQGSERRFDIRGEYQGILIIDDYAHHPTEIKATLAAAREKFPKKKICCVFQPHQYQRTFLLAKDFIKNFSEALNKNQVNELILIDVYDVAGREGGIFKKKISSEKIVKEIKKKNKSDNSVLYIPTIKKVEKRLVNKEVIIVMGAGDIYNLSCRLST
ncbi:MAG: hypothetical protein KAQ71_04515, partial [Desulfobulbaceae bacterium]|nr:hypothetical protein [Desulfobulbaceae bacterium]